MNPATSQGIAPLVTPAARGAKLRLEIVRTLDSLSPYAEAWDRLAETSPQRIPMSSYAWVASSFEHLLEPGISWVCLLALADTELVGVLPITISPDRVLGLRRSRLESACNLHTRSVTPVVAVGRAAEVLGFLLRGLHQAIPDWHRLDFQLAPDRSPLIAEWEQIEKPLPALKDPNGYTAYLPVSGSHKEYLDTLSSSFARNVRRLNTKIRTLGEPELLFFASDEIQDEHLDWFMKLEVSGWKGERGTAISQSPQLIAFYRSLISRMRARGWAEWHFLRVDGEPFAGHLAARIGRELVLLKIAYDDAHSSYGPGTVLMSGLFERTFAAGDIDEINCLTDMAWNHNWQMKIRPYYDLHIFRRDPLSMMGGYWPSKLRERAGSVGVVRQAVRHLRSIISRKPK